MANFISLLLAASFCLSTFGSNANASTSESVACLLTEAVPKGLMYTRRELELGTKREDRRLAININRITGRGRGDVHMNLLLPGARAGNHYHEHLIEYFINFGPGVLILHLRDPHSGKYQKVELPPVSLDEGWAYHVRPGVAHLVENPSKSEMTNLAIVVDEDNPNDIVPYSVEVPP